MPWYYCYADHGPGHQSSTEMLHYEQGKLTYEEKKYLFHHLFGSYDWPIGDIKLVKTLTKQEKEELLSLYQSKLKDAKQMLGIIKETPIQKTLRPRQLKAERRSRKVKKLIKEAQERNRKERLAKNG